MLKLSHTTLGIILFTSFYPSPAAAAPDESLSRQVQQDQLQREEQRKQDIQQRQPVPDVRLDADTPADSSIEPLPTETPCFPLSSIRLNGDSADQFQFSLRHALSRSGFTPGQCVGAQGINRLMGLAQNVLIERGYTTTRILAAPQDLNSGVLELTVVPGRIHAIRVDLSEREQTHAGRIASWQNEFPAKGGDILNLRDLEQGLENLKRVPTADADIQIIPAEQPNESDVVISWKQRRIPFRVSVGLDDSGSEATGKYQGSFTLSADNPLGLSDLAYVSYSRDLGHKNDLTDRNGQKTDSGTRSYGAHYSVPFGNWLLAWNYQYYRYHQAVAGQQEVYDYNGKSWSQDIGLTRLLYRDARRKTHLTLRLWQRKTQSFINDAEIDVQRRRTAGWSLALNHKEYLGRATLSAGITYKRGTGWLHSLPAPEERYDEGTARMRLLTTDLSLNLPFNIGRQQFVYDTHLHTQWNQTLLTALDRIAIGGRYTVRGFDGEATLSAERGWYWRNDLAWQYFPNHQVYLALDAGRVAGPSSKYLSGRELVGGGIGFKGQLHAGGSLYYDLFVGAPLVKPQYLPTADTTFGFSLNYSF